MSGRDKSDHRINARTARVTTKPAGQIDTVRDIREHVTPLESMKPDDPGAVPHAHMDEH